MRNNGTLLLALLLIALGSYLLLTEVGIGVPGWERVWPVLPLAGGLALLFNDLVDSQRNPERVFFGTAATLAGAFLLLVTPGGLSIEGLRHWWPAFLMIGGVAFLAQWAAAEFRDWDALFLALVALSIGAVGFALTFRLLGPNTREILPRLWPAILILAGVMALLRGLVGQRPH